MFAVEVSADEVAFLIEEVVDRAVDGGEFLKRLHPEKPLHRPFSSSEGLVGILDPVGQPASGLLATGGANRLQRGAIGSQTVGDDGAAAALSRVVVTKDSSTSPS